MYTPAETEAEARRWSALGHADHETLKQWVKDDVAIIVDLTRAMRRPLERSLREQLEQMRAKYEREATYLHAVLRGEISPNARVLRKSAEAKS